ncbi:unnamed protein product [Adineta steineri]|uniref:G-protein coupled receptors family 1 profile domain-containing protein n=2 Tax=Adineta steineri TaxID=433720 RepID=A0A818WLQ9_9BILA|nr:unnamed protein product [Adineta steineri]
MNSSWDNSTFTWYSIDSAFEVTPILKFWLFLVFDVYAIICTIFVLYHLLSERQARNALHNHIPIILLFLASAFEWIDIPFQLQYFHTGIVYPSTPILCLIWWFIDWGFYYIIAVLLVFASFERHILIFHSHLVATRRKRLIFHYVPILIILLLMCTFYAVAIFAPICESTFAYDENLCGVHACYGTIPFFVTVEQLVFGAAPICLIAIFSMTLLVRVIRQKHRIHGAIQWKKQRKLAIQMISLSLLYMAFSLPFTIIDLVRLYEQSDWGSEVLPLFFFLSYFTILLLPYVCLSNLPDLWKKLKICPTRQQRVGAIVPHA